MDHAMLPLEKSLMPHCMPSEITKQQCYEQYLKNIATLKSITCRLLAHTYMVRPKLHMVDLLLTYYTSKFATNTQEIKPIELQP